MASITSSKLKPQVRRFETMIAKVTSLRQDTLDAYEAAKLADNAWQAELDAQKIDRYTLAARGEQGSELRRLREAKIAADEKYHEAVRVIATLSRPGTGRYTRRGGLRR